MVAALGWAALAFPDSLRAAVPTITLGSVESTWQLDDDLSETNGGVPLAATGFVPSYAAIALPDGSDTALDLPALGVAESLDLVNAVGGNGGSLVGRTNEWTLVMDVRIPALANDVALLQTDPTNSDDAELHVMGGAGLRYEYYEVGALSVLPDFNNLVATTTGTVPGFDLSPRLRDENFAFRFRGKIRIPTAGSYTFHTTSDDGSQLFINGSLVVDNDGLHSVQTASGTVVLTEGTHDILVTHFENTGQEVLTVEYEGPGIARQVIPTAVLTSGDAGALRLGADTISDAAAIELGKWHRLAVTSSVSGDSLVLHAYVDGKRTTVGGFPAAVTKPLDGSWSLPGVVRLFTDDDGETLPLQVNALSFWGGSLGAVDLEALGAPAAPGLPDLYVSTTNNEGVGSLRRGTIEVRDGGLLFFEPALAGQSIVIGTGGPLSFTNKAAVVEARHLSTPVILDGGSSFRVFNILDGADVSLRGLAFENGSAAGGGGAIRNLAQLEVLLCVIRNCSASNGGGLINESSGTLTMIDTTISQNTAGAGGGLTNAGTATLRRCTISDNTAGSSGGVEDINSSTLINCTIANNTATDGGGGGLSALGTLTLTNCTVSGNSSFDAFGFSGGGGILLDFTATLFIDNTIIAGNTSNVTSEPNIGGFGLVSTSGANLTSGDPLLTPLGDFGGPTETMVPTAGSPAGGTGIPTANTPALDQRGFPRIIGILDLGAVETGLTGTASLYDSWAATNIPPGQDGLFNGDPDGDGIENGLEYAFGMNPQAFDSLLVPLAYPFPPTGLDRAMQIVIPFRSSASDLVYYLLEGDLYNYQEVWRYTVLTATETVTSPGLVTTIDSVNETITITQPVLNPVSTYWRVAIERAP